MADGIGKLNRGQLRRAQILALVTQRGFATIELLAQQLTVTLQTVRRDLGQLSEEGKVSRFHGGAGLPSSVENIDYSTARSSTSMRKFALPSWLHDIFPPTHRCSSTLAPRPRRLPGNCSDTRACDWHWRPVGQ